MVASLAMLAAACQQPGYTTCGELVCPEGYQCRDQQCISDDQVAVCEGQEEESACVSDLDGICRAGYCQINLCGNEQLDSYPERGDEPCDGELGRLACADAGADFGLTRCSASCAIDTSGCESFLWRRGITGTGSGRVVANFGDGLFVARGGLVSWTRTDKWKQSTVSAGTIVDLVPLSAEQVLAVTLQPAGVALWLYKGPTNERIDTLLSIAKGTGVRWSGAVVLDGLHVLASAGTALHLYTRSGDAWTDGAQVVEGTCPLGADFRLLWAASPSTVYAGLGTQVVQLVTGAGKVTCTVLHDLGQPVIAVGGVPFVLQWAVDGVGRVYDASTWTVRNSNPGEAVAIESAVAEYVAAGFRLWASEGDSIRMFDGHSWWRSSTGSTVLRDAFDDRVATHRPLAVRGARVLAVQDSLEVGLTERNAREWLTGWETPPGNPVLDITVDDTGLVWSLLAGNKLAVGSRRGDLTATPPDPVPSNPSVLLATRGNVYLGASNSVFKVAAVGASFIAAPEGGDIKAVRSLWTSGDGTLHALSSNGLYSKAIGAPSWIKLMNVGAGNPCVISARMAGVVIGSTTRLLVLCRAQNTVPRGNRLLVLDLPNGTPVAAVDLPDFVYAEIAATADGTAWLVGGVGRALRVAPPYLTVEALPVARKSPATGRLAGLVEGLTDVQVVAPGEVFISGARQNLFWWDGTRFVRVSQSQGGSASYVALAASGAHLYAAYESGVDVLFRDPP